MFGIKLRMFAQHLADCLERRNGKVILMIKTGKGTHTIKLTERGADRLRPVRQGSALRGSFGSNEVKAW